MAEYAYDVEALRNLGQRYARAVDDGNYDALTACFTADAVIDGVRGRTTVGDFVAALRTKPDGRSLHVLGAPLLDFDADADVALLDTYAVVHQWSPEVPRSTLAVRYLDDAVRSTDGWRIAHRQTVLLWAD